MHAFNFSCSPRQGLTGTVILAISSLLVIFGHAWSTFCTAMDSLCMPCVVWEV